MERSILSLFGISSASVAGGGSEVDLLSKVVASAGDSEVKTRIASAARPVLDAAAADDDGAVQLISHQVSCLIDNTLGRLLNPKSCEYQTPEHCGLIISGSVTLHESYQAIFRRSLANRGIQFAYIESVPDAAAVGIEYLLSARTRIS